MEEEIKKIKILKIIRLVIIILIVLTILGMIYAILINRTTCYNPNEMTEQQITIFNQKYISTVGENVEGSKVRALIRQVIINNAQNVGEETKTIYVDTEGTGNEEFESAKLSHMANLISSHHIYTVTIEYNEEGLVHIIRIVDNDIESEKEVENYER